MKTQIKKLKEAREKMQAEIKSTITTKEYSQQIVLNFSESIPEIKEPLLSQDGILVSEELIDSMKVTDEYIENMPFTKQDEQVEPIGNHKCCCEVM